jgi:hypothetical protein
MIYNITCFFILDDSNEDVIRLKLSSLSFSFSTLSKAFVNVTSKRTLIIRRKFKVFIFSFETKKNTKINQIKLFYRNTLSDPT